MIKEGQTGEVPEETGGRGGLMIDFIIYKNRMPSNDKTIDENNTSGYFPSKQGYAPFRVKTFAVIRLAVNTDSEVFEIHIKNSISISIFIYLHSTFKTTFS